jgi:hypothetical protein
MMTEKEQISGLHLTVSLFKDGCEWQGDICSKRWAEYMVVPLNEHVQARVARTLECYTAGEDYKLELDADGKPAAIWIK